MSALPASAGDAPDIPDAVRAKVSRMLLWYPGSWRARYGDEFAELLAAYDEALAKGAPNPALSGQAPP